VQDSTYDVGDYLTPTNGGTTGRVSKGSRMVPGTGRWVHWFEDDEDPSGPKKPFEFWEEDLSRPKFPPGTRVNRWEWNGWSSDVYVVVDVEDGVGLYCKYYLRELTNEDPNGNGGRGIVQNWENELRKSN